MSGALLTARGLSKSYPWRAQAAGWRGARLRALIDVDLDVEARECLALVGESGSGKTTLGRTMLRLLEPDSGEIRFEGHDLLALSGSALRRLRTRFQMVFQDAASALDPRLRIGQQLAEPLALHGLSPRAERPARVRELLAAVGLAESLADRYPYQLSGGQRQRVGIARALATEPRLLVLDEPVSALDVSVRAQILRLLAELRERFDLAMVVIAHDLAMVEQIADRVAVLYLGRLVEEGHRATIFARPQHPYTVALLAAVPVPDPARRKARRRLVGEVPSPLDPPSGCPFHPRCPIARSRCRVEMPPLRQLESGGRVACHYPGEARMETSSAAASRL